MKDQNCPEQNHGHHTNIVGPLDTTPNRSNSTSHYLSTQNLISPRNKHNVLKNWSSKIGSRAHGAPPPPLARLTVGTPKVLITDPSLFITGRWYSQVFRRTCLWRSSVRGASSRCHCRCPCCPHNNLVFYLPRPHTRRPLTSLHGRSHTTHPAHIKHNYIIQNKLIIYIV